jgi:prolyl 4-hydroxylase
MGKIAYEELDYYHTVNWMQESLRLYEIEGTNSTANIIDILDYLSFAIAKQGNLNSAFELTKRILSLGYLI